MRLGYDLRIARFGLSGTRRYSVELLRHLRPAAPPGWDVVALAGSSRLDRDGRAPARLRRVTNLASDLGWLSAGVPLAVARHAIDVWLSPANVLPVHLPRPMLVTIHDLNFHVVPHLYDPGYVRVADRMYRLAVRQAERVLVISRLVREMVVEVYGVPRERVVIIPPGLDHLEVPVPTVVPVPGPYALFVGQTEPHKNLGLLLDAWRAGVPDDLHLVICGRPGRDDAALRQRAERSEIRERVHFTGGVPPGELAALYRGAGLFLFPSLAEGFGFPPLEAMRAGIPTAVAATTALPETTGGAALTFDPYDATALAALVTRMCDDEDLRSRLRIEGLRVAAGYRWPMTSGRVWDEVLGAVAV